MEKRNEFINLNGHIVPKPEGVDYSLAPNKIYTLMYSRQDGDLFIEESKDFEFPKVYYQTNKDKKFVKRVLDTYKKTEKLTTGVLLSGLKGSGKTLMSKWIAKESNLPVIVIDSSVCSEDIEGFFAKINTDVCVVFDEIDKYWNTRYLLGFLDGVKPSCKKLVICTCNDEKEIDKYLNDRCSRIRYKKTFDSLNKDVVAGIINDVIKDKTKADAAAEYCMTAMSVVSHDNVIIFAEEVKNNPKDSFDEIISFLNISKK